MADYISREAAVAVLRKAADCANCNGMVGGICDFCSIGNAARLFKDIPAADVEPVRHGVWENTSKMYGAYSGRCSVCKLASGMWHINQPYRFCPFCGARLRLEDKKK